jgi:membrane protein DedA with SNARE-associated domain
MEHFIVRTLVDYGYVAVFSLMMLQAAGIPIPSEVTMALGGAAASATFVAATLGDGSQPLTLVGVIVAGVLGDLAGSWIAYGIGRIGGRPLVRRWGVRIFRREHEVERAERWFARYGERAVFVSKLLPIARSYISFPAGVAEMQPFRFSLFVVLGTLPFAILMTLLGYVFGHEVVRYLREIAYAFAVLVGVALVWWFLRRSRRPERPVAERQPERAGQGPAD